MDWAEDDARSIARCARVSSYWSDVALKIMWNTTWLETFIVILIGSEIFISDDGWTYVGVSYSSCF